MKSPAHLSHDDIVIDGGNSYYRDDLAARPGAPARHPFRRRGHQRRRLRPRPRLLPHVRRRGSGGRHLEPIFGPSRRASARPEHAGPRRHAERGRAGLPPLRRARLRPLREDGAQRHRVRDHGGLRRRPGRAQEGGRRDGGSRQGRRDGAAARTQYYRYSSTWRRSPRCGGVAAWSGRGCSTSPLAAIAMAKSPELSEFEGYVPDSGEGRWTVQAAIEEDVPAHILTTALFTSASAHAGRTCMPTSCSRRCASSSAATPRRPGSPERACRALRWIRGERFSTC